MYYSFSFQSCQRFYQENYHENECKLQDKTMKTNSIKIPLEGLECHAIRQLQMQMHTYMHTHIYLAVETMN